MERPYQELSRRERQIMDSVYRRGQATVADVLEDLPDAPSYSAVRAMLGKLERKGHLQHEEDGPRYVYLPTTPREVVQESALKRMVRTFFDGSASKTVAALLDRSAGELTDDELDELARLIDEAKKREE